MYKSTRKEIQSEGRLPPQSVEIEKSLLGCFMVDPTIISKVSEIISVDTFYVPMHGYIYEAMISLFQKSYAIDYLTVHAELKRTGKVNDTEVNYIRDLTEVTSISAYESYARHIEEKAIARRGISLCNEMMAQLFDGEEDVIDLMRKHQDDMFKATSALSTQKNITPEFVGNQMLEKTRIGMQSGGMTGIPYGIEELDELTGGMQNGTVITIGARTRHGKTAVAVAFAHNATSILNPRFGFDPNVHCTSLYPVCFFSMEMVSPEVFARLVSMEIKISFDRYIPYSNISRGRITDEQYKIVVQAKEKLQVKGIYIDDTPALNTQTLKAKVMTYINKFGIKAAFFDYIQIGGDNKEDKGKGIPEKIEIWYRDIKNMAKLFDIPIVPLSQGDRQTEKTKEGTRPLRIADLKGSSGIENGSDVILLLYREEVNNPTGLDELGQSVRGKIQIDVAKQKNGDTKLITVPFNVETNTFEKGVNDFVDVEVVETRMQQNNMLTNGKQGNIF